MACFFFSACALRVVHLCKICTGHLSYSMIVACTAGHLLCDIWKCSELRDLAHMTQSSAAVMPCRFRCDSRNITGAFNFQHYEGPALVV